MSAAVLIGIATVVALTVMAVVWLISERIQNAGIVDVAWAGLFAVLALIYGTLAPGDALQRGAAAAMMILWSVRLTSHLWKRNIGHLDVEDARYAGLRKKWGSDAGRKMFWFFEFQALSNLVLSMVILFCCLNPSPVLSLVQWAGLLVWAIALGGEALSDDQLRKFKADPDNRGKVMNDGLWRYSRHPNYFFEWLVWVAWFLFALDQEWGWTMLHAPLLMLWFLYKVTGIPATEKHSLESRGEAYREYQRTTSPFIPWFPRGRTSD